MAESIVRSLLVNVGFAPDRRSITQTDRAITGVKTRFALVGSAITLVGGQIINFLNGISANAKGIDNLSRSLGISVNELLAMEKAASNIGIDASSFQNVLRITDNLFQDFRQGGSRLREFARGLRIEIDPNGNAQDALNAILIGLRNIENEQQRIAVAREYFPGLGVQVSDLARDFDKFSNSTQNFLATQGDIQPVIDGLKEYDKAINSLNNSFISLAQNVITLITPALNALSGTLNLLVGTISSILNADMASFVNSVKNFSDQFLDKPEDNRVGFLKRIGYELNQDLFLDNQSPLARIPYTAPGGTSNMTNNIEINVPVGTTEEQANFISESIINAIDDRIFNTFMQVQSNNPVVE